MTQYVAMTDLWLPGNIYAPALSVLSDVIPTPAGMLPIPVGWPPPCQAVSPADSAALTAVFNQGPRLSAAQGWLTLGPWNYQAARFTGMSGYNPSTYWWQPAGQSSWFLKNHENLGVGSPGPLPLTGRASHVKKF